MAHAMNFTAWCLGSDESNSNRKKRLRRLVVRIGRVAEFCLIVERETRLEVWEQSRPLLTNHKKHSEQIMTGCLWIPTIDECTVSVMPTGSKRCPRSARECNQEGTWHIYMFLPRTRKECMCC